MLNMQYALIPMILPIKRSSVDVSKTYCDQKSWWSPLLLFWWRYWWWLWLELLLENLLNFMVHNHAPNPIEVNILRWHGEQIDIWDPTYHRKFSWCYWCMNVATVIKHAMYLNAWDPTCKKKRCWCQCFIVSPSELEFYYFYFWWRQWLWLWLVLLLRI